ncbi:MAG TPA: hypothetical protein VE987_07830 [Polyangiaceae bacterium]|nr:hypothetical protein [Polyangiaceae bacterium]
MSPRHPLRIVAAAVVAALVVTLGTGAGLPGVVRALTASSGHVCTCATGGSHAACPVCNPSLSASRSHELAIDGRPCGGGRLAVGEGDSGLVPEFGASPRAPFTKATAWRPEARPPTSVPDEPLTPPPRSSALA